MKRTWQDIAEIALDLAERYPEIDPLTVSLPDVRRLVTTLPSFGDDPGVATPAVLEAIQAAWYEAREN